MYDSPTQVCFKSVKRNSISMKIVKMPSYNSKHYRLNRAQNRFPSATSYRRVQIKIKFHFVYSIRFRRRAHKSGQPMMVRGTHLGHFCCCCDGRSVFIGSAFEKCLEYTKKFPWSCTGLPLALMLRTRSPERTALSSSAPESGGRSRSVRTYFRTRSRCTAENHGADQTPDEIKISKKKKKNRK